MKILVTGSTGLVGSALVAALAEDGHTVLRLLRPDSVVPGGTKYGIDVRWDPKTGEWTGLAASGAQVNEAGLDAAVNLSGASIAGGRWTKERKELLHTSRIDSTRALVHALAKLQARPRVLVSASAIGIYGDRGDEVLTEESKAGTDFLARLTGEWEAEALKAEGLGVRVVLARFGIILSHDGGALPKMMLPFRFGAGGKLGSGKQWMSWVAIQDVVGILKCALENSSVRGAVNVVSPTAVQNAGFVKLLARTMRRPAVFPAPAFALRVAMGEMADALLLSSQRVVPQKLEQLGYSFVYPELSGALRAVLA